ncbi:MAG: M56 family metallopeptidase, partial [Bacteroidota bacterium]
QLSVQEVEVILAHELAHIARHDYLFNILQSIVEVLFFFHPVVWWLSANIRKERENCCDDLALHLCNDPLIYAKTLVCVEELQQTFRPPLAMTLFGSKKQLLTRVQRILNHPQSKSNTMEKMTATALLLLALCGYAATNSFEQTNSETNAITTTTSSTESEVRISDTSTPLDTLPSRTYSNLRIKNDEQNVHVKVRNGEIQYLKVDGKKIKPADFKDYENMVENLSEDTPPASPVPPTPPNAPMITIQSGETRIEKQVEEDGQVICSITKTEKAPVVITVDGNDEVQIKGNATFLDTEEGANEVIILDNGKLEVNGRTVISTHESDVIELDDLDLNIISDGGGFDLASTMAILEDLDLGNLLDNLDLDFDDHTNITVKGMSKEDAQKYLGDLRIYLDGKQHELQDLQLDIQDEVIIIQNEIQEKLEKDFVHLIEMDGGNDLLVAGLKNALLEDGLIESGKKFKFLLTHDELKINRKVQSAALHQKYKELVEGLTFSKINNGDRVKLRITDNSTFISISID